MKPSNSDEEAFIREIVSNPAEDSVRMVFADYLQESEVQEPCVSCQRWTKKENENWVCVRCSGTRLMPSTRFTFAEFIRLQIQIARMFAAADIPLHCQGNLDLFLDPDDRSHQEFKREVMPLVWRQNMIMSYRDVMDFVREPFPDFPEGERGGCGDLDFERGFLSGVSFGYLDEVFEIVVDVIQPNPPSANGGMSRSHDRIVGVRPRVAELLKSHPIHKIVTRGNAPFNIQDGRFS